MRLLLSFALCFLCFTLFAQQILSTVKGRIQISGGSAGTASIYFLNAKDSSLVKCILSEPDGTFLYPNAKPGSYLLKFTHIGTETRYQALTISKPQAIDLGKIELVPTSRKLNEVIISDKRPFIERKAGKTVITLANSPVSAGNNLLDLLGKMPGISVGNNDQV